MKPIDQTTPDLDALLDADATAFHAETINNDGFADRVMARVADLPAPLASGQWWRLLIICACTLTAATSVMIFGAGGNFVIDAVMDLATQTITPAAAALMVTIVAVGLLGVGSAVGE